jgi:hypothetical protein
MRKRIIALNERPCRPARWLPLEDLVEVEVTSEAPGFPIDSALALEGGGQGWRAAQPGPQLVRLVFDRPTSLHRIGLQFVETENSRSHEFVLRWSAERNGALLDIVRQQWTFSPHGSTSESEDYQVNLSGLQVLELAINPDISGGNAHASLDAWRVA